MPPMTTAPTTMSPPTPIAGMRHVPRTAVTMNMIATSRATIARMLFDGMTACTSVYEAPSNRSPSRVRIEYRSRK